MNTRVAILFVAFANGMLLGQTPHADRVQRLVRQFPPEVVLPAAASNPASLMRSSCVHVSHETKALSVKPCAVDSGRLRIVRFEKLTLPVKPATAPGMRR